MWCAIRCDLWDVVWDVQHYVLCDVVCDVVANVSRSVVWKKRRGVGFFVCCGVCVGVSWVCDVVCSVV